MRKLIYLLIAGLLMSSCYHINEKELEVPENLIHKDTLVEILTEMQLTESSFMVSEDMKLERSMKPKYYEAILKAYKVTLNDIRDNLNYYQSKPKEMEDIYESVLEKLSIYQSKVELEIVEKERIRDSIKAANDSIAAINDSIIVDTIVPLKKKDLKIPK